MSSPFFFLGNSPVNLADLLAQFGRGHVQSQTQGPPSDAVGRIFPGHMPPMMWIEQEQRQIVQDNFNNDAETLRNMGNQAFREGKLEQAVEYYTQSIDAKKSCPLTYSNRAQVYLKMEKYEASLQDAREAIRLDPSFFKPYVRIGLVHMAQHDYDSALKFLELAMERAPGTSEKEEIKILIAKCEAKRARVNATASPGPQGVPSAGASTAGGARIPPHAAVAAFAAQSAALSAAAEAIAAAAAARGRLGALAEAPAVAPPAEALGGAGRRAAAVRALLGRCGPTALAAGGPLGDGAVASAQGALRAAVERGEWAEVTAALGQRDAALQRLWQAAADCRAAAAEVRKLDSEEIAMGAVRRTEETSGYQNEDLIRSKVESYKTCLERIAEGLDFVGNTDVALNALMVALRDEAAALKRMEVDLQQFQELHSFVKGILQEKSVNVTSMNVNDLRTVQEVDVRAKEIESEAESFKRGRLVGAELVEEESRIERERLRMEKIRIRIQGELEWMEVQGQDDENQKSRLRDALAQVREQIRILVDHEKALQQKIEQMISGNYPELTCYAAKSGPRLLKWLKGHGLWINHALPDYRERVLISESTSSKIYRANCEKLGEVVALKKFALIPDDLSQFRNIVSVFAMLGSHPRIIKLHGIFLYGDTAFAVMPFYSETAEIFLSKGRILAWYQLQDILRQIASGIAHIHDRGICHGDISPTHVLMTEAASVAVCGFRHSREMWKGNDVTLPAPPHAEFAAPERLSGEKIHGVKEDIWSLGMLFFYLATRGTQSLPALMPKCDSITVDASIIGNELLTQLINSMLRRDPSTRPSADEVLAHPYFAVSMVHDMITDTHVLSSNEKISAVKNFLATARQVHNRPTLISVARSKMVESMTSVVMDMNENAMLGPLIVVFRGEQGVDEGALLTEALNLYFEQAELHGMLVANKDSTNLSAAEYVVSDDSRIPRRRFEVLGRLLLKSLIESRPIALQLNASLFKFLVSADPSLSDLESFDPILVRNLKKLLTLSSDDLDAISMDFSDISQQFLSWECPEFTQKTLVQQSNIRKYVQLRCKYELIGRRKEQLEALRKGFWMCSALRPHLELLSPTELMILLCGEQHLRPEVIVNALEFHGFPTNSSTPELLRDVLRTMTQSNLRRFLSLATASVTLPRMGPAAKIRVVCTRTDTSRLPVGHGCVGQLDLPDYNDRVILSERLGVALAHINDGFHIV